jgi:hypothetical protein
MYCKYTHVVGYVFEVQYFEGFSMNQYDYNIQDGINVRGKMQREGVKKVIIM